MPEDELVSPRKDEECLLCGVPRPSGHVVVDRVTWDGVDDITERGGVICSSHSFLDLAKSSLDFAFSVTLHG